MLRNLRGLIITHTQKIIEVYKEFKKKFKQKKKIPNQ